MSHLKRIHRIELMNLMVTIYLDHLFNWLKKLNIKLNAKEKPTEDE